MIDIWDVQGRRGRGDVQQAASTSFYNVSIRAEDSERFYKLCPRSRPSFMRKS